MSRVCPCCGYRGLDRAAALCGICAWEDRDPYGSRGWSSYAFPALVDAQRSFAACGAADPAVREFTRAPRPDESRPPWFTPIVDAPGVIVALIEHAFEDVLLDGGVSLDEAELIDAHELPSRTELDPPPRGHGVGPPWQDLTTAGLDRMPWGNFPFQDARGIRYHLPAFMRAHLRDPKPPGAIESLLFTLRSGHRLAALRGLLTRDQGHAVARYLAHLGTVDSYYAPHAGDALREQWGAYLEPEHLAHVMR
ncbi:MAG: hypothetical protein H0T79_12385 [Deltaproteobacteria bacterium]|nr:hypothetical protein [Deltaproteobacteria bacterium]